MPRQLITFEPTSHLRLFLIAALFLLFGISFGFLINTRNIENNQPIEVSTSSNAANGSERISGKSQYSGIVKPYGTSGSEATHYLEDGEGKIMILLKSSKIDLSFVEGQQVAVEGVEGTIKDSGQKIVDVERVIL